MESLVRRVISGGLRVPFFQRGLRWDFSDVRDLLDSIRRGLPVGSLLIWKKPGAAGRFKIGPLTIDAQARHDVWWVVDGQQRLTSLAATLGRELPLGYPSDPYVVYFDPVEQVFCQPHADGSIPDQGVPLPYLFDASVLSEFVLEWSYATNRKMRNAVFECGKRLREYQVPIYLVETDNLDVLKNIFYRVNNSGKALKWDEVHDALHVTENGSLSTIRDLVEEVAQLGWGRISEKSMTPLLLAMRGEDVTRPLGDHLKRDRDALKGAVEEALSILPRVINFFRFEAEIPHLRLLPRLYLLEFVTRLLALHPNPKVRTLHLMRRCVWRLLLGRPIVDREATLSERTLRRRLISAIDHDEEASLQRLLDLVPESELDVLLYERFDARSASSRTALLLLSTLGPRHLETGEVLNLTQVIETHGEASFVKAVRGQHLGVSRLLHPPLPSLSARIAVLVETGAGLEVLESHGIDKAARMELRQGDESEFCYRRFDIVQSLAVSAGERLAEWSAPDRDRPSLEYILSQVEGDDGV